MRMIIAMLYNDSDPDALSKKKKKKNYEPEAFMGMNNYSFGIVNQVF